MAAICDDDECNDRLDDAIALMTVCVGGMALSRAVADPKFSSANLAGGQGSRRETRDPNTN